MKTYRHLSRNERDEVAVLLARRASIRKIAFHLGRSPSTLSRELKRNKHSKGYGPIYAQLAAVRRRHKQHGPTPRLMRDKVLRQRVIRELKDGWSPEIIAGRLKQETGRCVIGHEAIYRWIYSHARHLAPYLVRSHRRRQHRSSRPWPNRLIPRRISITQRPMEINLRQVPGHWETDLVWGSGYRALQVLVERQTRFVRLISLPNKTAQASYNALAVLLSSVPGSLRRSITYDNGIENILHVEINERFHMRSFFCEPYHAWEKGTVENTNGLVRRFFPKRTNLDHVSPGRIQRIEDWLNNRPRKCLNFKTPAEALQRVLH